MDTSTFLVVRHEANVGPGHLHQWAHEAGASLRVLAADAGEPVPSRLPDDVSGLVVLGGDMGAYDDARFGWLSAAKALLADAVRRDRPVLGVCLGHQLLTVALGGQVRRSPRGLVRDIVDVDTVAAGTDDPVFGRLRAPAPVVQWNRDTVVALPSGADVLARDDSGAVQVVRFAPRAWGLQVHPEAVVEDAATWARPDDTPAQRLVADLDARTDEITAAWGPAMTAFFAVG